jgi:predicted nuclease with TOPRIM domain
MSRVTTVRGGKLEVVKTTVDTQSYTVEHLLSEKERLEARIERTQEEISRLNTDITVINADLFKLRG